MPKLSYEQGVKDLAKALINYYNTLGGSNSFAPLVAFHIEQKAKELLEGEDICKNIHQKK
jgi:hypothetical protein